MNKRLLVLILISLITFSGRPALAGKHVERNVPTEQIEARKFDPEAEILAKYLAKHNSPLQFHAQDFIDAARQYDLDWRLVSAIAGVESTFGKFTPGGYNGWGWGVYGNQAIYFKSWREGIYTVSQGLRENYIDRGLTNPYLMNRAYATSPRWGSKVTFFIEDIEKFAKEYNQTRVVAGGYPLLRIAVISGQLAL